MNLIHHQDTFSIAQLSDLHLSDGRSFDGFLKVLKLAVAHSPDLLLLTGDLVNDGKTDGYDWLFKTLHQTNIPYLCMMGNHDVTQEMGHERPFNERQFLPIKADDRLIRHHRLTIEMTDTTWQILTLNSTINGKIHGRLSSDEMQFLQVHLSDHTPTIIALHHHPRPVGSAWIDAHMLSNGDDFWRTIAPYDGVKAVLCGHVHQAHSLQIDGKTLHTCPAVSRQFRPHQDDFAIDDVAAGFRLIQICNKKTLETCIKRVQN
ncbi:metallophosphoesterase [Moraxella oculi]|uniref:Metallophosphoesterase n=1 Tax=Moraxella oculi TaxID=2940516 RepID=A0ABW8U4X1_9GAMM